MLSSSDLSFSRTLPLNVFNQLGELLEQMAQAVGNDTLIVTEAVLSRVCISAEWQRQKFTLLVSERFSALLVGTQQDMGRGEEFTSLNARLTFSAEAIASFIAKLQNSFGCDSSTYLNLGHYCRILAPNDATFQSQFTLLLLEYLLPYSNQEVTTLPNSNDSKVYYQTVEDALKKQISQERLLNQVTNQLRKSLDLPVIMATVVTQVREFLDLDRLVIYKFQGSRVKSQNSSSLVLNSQLSVQNYEQYGGCVIHETLARETIPSVLNYREETCFMQTSQCWEKYRQGFTLVVNDVEQTYALEECLLNFFRASQIRGKLAVPIICEDQLWGLLIAHQCHAPHQWTESEIKLLSAIAEQLAIAIHQAELIGTLRDTTQTLTQDKQLLEQQVIERTMALREALLAAEAASRLRNEFLATISHELLTPLTYVIGMSSTLLRWPLGELSQRQRDYLQTIHDSGEHLLGMIHDILDLSQIEAGKTVLNITEFSLVNIAENAVESLQDKAKTQQVNLKLDLQIDPKRDRFTADVPRLEQILTNLLTNAIKFTPENGNVTLRLWVEDNTAIFQVEDTGIGISENQLSLLFEKFQQLDTPYRRRYAGTGLGLALTKQLIELHRGRIEVESTVGIGSIFTVWIPGVRSREQGAESRGNGGDGGDEGDEGVGE